MSFKIIFFLFIFHAFFFNHSFAETKSKKRSSDHHSKGHDHSKHQVSLKSKSKGKLVIRVKGMVCAFCAQGIEKNFNKQDQVKSTKVDLDKMEVTILLKPGKTLSENTLKSIVTSAGFGYAGVK